MARKIHERHRLAEGSGELRCETCGQIDDDGEPIFPCDAAQLASVIVVSYAEQDEST